VLDAAKPGDADFLPPCPITGKPALRRIQTISRSLLTDLWRYTQGVDVVRLLESVDRIGIYESPTGLIYFHPPITGDGDFYADYYARWEVHKGLTHRSGERADYIRTAAHVPAGAKVIDVGCGPGAFRGHLKHALFTGLDPYAAPGDPAIVRESLEAHAGTHAGAYDVATAFHVIEHVADPRRHFGLMVDLVRPGGLIVLAAPLFPSLLSEIPNFPVNMPPHHVTWWNPSSFSALAAEYGLDVIESCSLPPSPHQGLIFWLHRLLPVKTTASPDERYYAHRWSWHASLSIGYLLSKVAVRLKAMPSGVAPVDAYLVARKR
jgi:SAM-dependent methyltransferase